MRYTNTRRATLQRASLSSRTRPKKSQKIRNIILIALPLLCMLAGVYILLLTQSPNVKVPIVGLSKDPPLSAVKITEDRLYVPKLDVNITYKSGTDEVLKDNAWWRFPERGDPVKGGNFILAAHRFELGLWPGETKRRSPFYHLDRLQEGDSVYIDFQGTRYKYEVTRRYSVAPTDIAIEDPSENAKLTLYSCTLKGSKDGREIVEAHLVTANLDLTTPLD